jgi:hypothetical protein
MAKAKASTRLQLPKAKLLKFNRHGKSVSMPTPQRDWVAERLPTVREICSDATWARVQPIYAAVMENDMDKLAALYAQQGWTVS